MAYLALHAISTDTCSIAHRSGCGPVNLTVTTTEPATVWINNGVRSYQWNDVIYREAGDRRMRFSSSTGAVHRVPLKSPRAFMDKYNEATVIVTTGNKRTHNIHTADR